MANILDVAPQKLHDRCPIFIGSAEDVKDFLKFNSALMLTAS